MLLINFLVLDNEARAKHQGDSIRLRHCHDEAARASPDMAEARELPGRNSSDPAAAGELSRRAFSFGHPHYKPSISNDGWSGSSGTLEVIN